MGTYEVNRNDMVKEAAERLRLMKVSKDDVELFLSENTIQKVHVNFEDEIIIKERITDEELQMIHQIEEEKDVIIYYMIQDEGIWLDGCTFPRYTFLHVDKYIDDYKMVKEECIKRCKMVMAYVVNMEEADYSELTEIAYRNCGGVIINAS